MAIVTTMCELGDLLNGVGVIPSQHHCWLGITTCKTPLWRPKPNYLVNAHVTINQNHKTKGTLKLTFNKEILSVSAVRIIVQIASLRLTQSSAIEIWNL